jgi:deoxycytidylate deaminase
MGPSCIPHACDKLPDVSTLSAVTWKDRTYWAEYPESGEPAGRAASGSERGSRAEPWQDVLLAGEGTTPGLAGDLRRAGEPRSSLTQLVQGVWEADPGMARAILRRRILTTGEIGPLERGMVKTAAQRVARVEALAPEPGWLRVAPAARYEPPALDASERALPPMEIARRLAALSSRQGALRERDRPVGCVLVDAAGAPLAWAHNTNATNRTLHAELNLMQWWWARTGGPLPPGARLYTTLEPCRMCRGMLYTCGPATAVRYSLADGVPEDGLALDCREEP